MHILRRKDACMHYVLLVQVTATYLGQYQWLINIDYLDGEMYKFTVLFVHVKYFFTPYITSEHMIDMCTYVSSCDK